jgi:AAA domain
MPGMALTAVQGNVVAGGTCNGDGGVASGWWLMKWLWAGCVPLGKKTLFTGDPEVGKSFVTPATADALSRGRPLSGGEVPDRPASAIGRQHRRHIDGIDGSGICVLALPPMCRLWCRAPARSLIPAHSPQPTEPLGTTKIVAPCARPAKVRSRTRSGADAIWRRPLTPWMYFASSRSL